MHVRLAAIGSHGDVLPILALAVELKRRGHPVTFAAPAPYLGAATAAGVDFHPLGTVEAFEAATHAKQAWHPRKGIRPVFDYYSTLTEPTYRWLVESWRPGDCIVASTVALGARLAQDHFGFPVATVHVVPLCMESRIAPPILPGLPFAHRYPPRFLHWLGRGADEYVLDPVALPPLNAVRAGLGLRPVRRLRFWWNSPTRVILMAPAWYAPRQPDWPAQAVQVNFPASDRLGDSSVLDPSLLAFLDGQAPLAFTYGSTMREASRFFETAVRTCLRLRRRGILLAPQSGQVPATLPEGVIHVPYAPFSALLPRCAALVHHGGIGTIAQAMRAGIPQCIVPYTHNHFDDADRLVRLGVAARLSRHRFTPRRAARALTRLLASPQVARACAEARDRMQAEDGVIAACDAIEGMG